LTRIAYKRRAIGALSTRHADAIELQISRTEVFNDVAHQSLRSGGQFEETGLESQASTTELTCCAEILACPEGIERRTHSL